MFTGVLPEKETSQQMDVSAARGFSEPGMDENGFMRQFTAKHLAAAFGEHSVSSGSYTFYTPSNLVGGNKCSAFSDPSIKTSQAAGYDKRVKLIHKTSSWTTCTTEESSSVITSVSSPDSPTYPPNIYTTMVQEAVNPSKATVYGPKRNYETMGGESTKLVNLGIRPCAQEHIIFGEAMKPKEGIGHGSEEKYETMAGFETKIVSSGSRPSAQEHIIAERKRREKLSQRFIALSSIMPGLKKVDKVSVLQDTIKYIKGLQERMQILEEQNVGKTVKSVVLVKKSQVTDNDDGSSSSDEDSDGSPSRNTLPEIEARISEKAVVLKIHCENRKGILVKVLSEIEKLNLSIMNSNSVPFPGSSLYLTVTGKFEGEFSMTVKALVKKLNATFKQFM